MKKKHYLYLKTKKSKKERKKITYIKQLHTKLNLIDLPISNGIFKIMFTVQFFAQLYFIKRLKRESRHQQGLTSLPLFKNGGHQRYSRFTVCFGAR